ncbi:MAG: hypothetical protein HY554_12845 [Elusimicrobia bacterium]|nr:hypothetical protein [Elusimicrobiota bacterium]
MKTPILAAALLFASASAGAGERYTLKDEGVFAPTGRHVEFADRYGWRSYEAKFDFGFEADGRTLAPDSSLSVTIHRKEGGSWSYRCRARERREMWANVNHIYGKGLLVVAECRVRPDKFAGSVGLDADMVGDPTLVFSAMVRNGGVESGVQKGFYFLTAGQIRSGMMGQYATENEDPTDLAVLFATQSLAKGKTFQPHHYYYQPVARFIP